MEQLLWILGGGVLMTAVALVGAVSFLVPDETLRRVALPLVAFSAGSLLGGAFFHMLPAALHETGHGAGPFVWMVAGFTVFLGVEQFLHWHHCHHETADCHATLPPLILLGDAIHNFLGGLAIAGTFLIDVRLGVVTWLAAAAHELPQELGNFAVLIHSGWSRRKALLWTVASQSTFLAGGLATWFGARGLDTSAIVAFAAGNFVYIAASDLVPEVNRNRDARRNVIHFGAFLLGAGVLLALRVLVPHAH
ncbi:MAG: ZIP family metal transporter [Myxococcales bacterium]|nr:ZIP family metal transporter [Myxococcales bacterium]